MVDGIAVFLRQGQIDFIGVHDGGKDVLLSVQLAGKAVGFPVELLGELVAAVLLEVICVHVQNHLVIDVGVFLQPT